MSNTTTMPVGDVRYVKELYPRLKPLDDVIERYRDALDNLPPIAVARDGVLVDGYHRWQAHVRQGRDEIAAENLGDLSDAEIVRESYRRNAIHGEQLSKSEKVAAAEHLYVSLTGTADERYAEIASVLSLSIDSATKYSAKARQAERERKQAKAWTLWLDCEMSQEQIGAELGESQRTISNWLEKREQSSVFSRPPGSARGTEPGDDGYWGSIQHFDVWQFQNADRESGQQSYFGAVPPQVLENLLWLWTGPSEIVVDLFAGSGTTIDVAKAMGRRVWASDIRGNHYSPHLPIHQHDATNGWPSDAPRKANLIFLDPPYWKQAAGRYSSEPGELAEMDYFAFIAAWRKVIDACKEHLEDGGRIAYIISPTQLDSGQVIDHAYDMAGECILAGLQIERRIIVPYQTQQATGQQVEWAREHKRLLKLYRDLVVLSR